MTPITINLPEDRVHRLQELATRLGVQPEDLVRLSIDELLGRPDEAFERIADYVLSKNSELYRRLA